MPVQQDQLNSTNTNITFEDFNYSASGSFVPTNVTRLLHNGTDLLRLKNNIMRYYQTDGTAKVSYSIQGVPTSGIVRDIAYDFSNSKYYAFYHVPGTSGVGMSGSIKRLNSNGSVDTTLIADFNPSYSGSSELLNSQIELAVHETAPYLYVRIANNMYRIDKSLTYTGTVDETHSGVLAVPGVFSSFSGSANSLVYNKSLTNLCYLYYDANTSEAQILTLDSGTVTPLDRRVFLNIPDFSEHFYPVYFQYPDSASLFYLRMAGTSQLNTSKVTSTSGTVTTAGLVTDTSQNYTTSKVKRGDFFYFTSGVHSGQSYVITSVNSSTSVTLVTRGTEIAPSLTAGTYSYKIMSNAEQLHFNVDPDISAFSAVNTDNFSLKAGDGDVANITAEVINCWGDPSIGKEVTYQIIAGDGVINPPSSTTNISGVATTQYTAGIAVGAVQVQVTITD